MEMEMENNSLSTLSSSLLFYELRVFVVIEFQSKWIYNCKPGAITEAYCRPCNPSPISVSPSFFVSFEFFPFPFSSLVRHNDTLMHSGFCAEEMKQAQ